MYLNLFTRWESRSNQTCGIIKGLPVRQSSLADRVTLDAFYLGHPS